MSKRMVGPFEVGDRIGIGGMGIVYRATYTKNGAPVALKILSPELSDSESLQKRFEREVAILKKMKHPNIVRYYGGGKFGSQRFYAMELVTGGSVEDLLTQRNRLPWREALDILLQAAKALEHAHEAGVIHRDLKPANLLISATGEIKLTDFGIARDTTATALTAAGKTVGTYAYMAPEQIRGKPPVDKKTDLYALGCVLFELISGETPFQSKNQGELLMMHLQEEPPRVTSLVPDCPQEVEDLIFHLLEKEPESRPFDALALQVEIEGVFKRIEEQEQQAAATKENEAAATAMGLTGATTTKAGPVDAAAKKKKKKKKDDSPVWEQTWFLATLLTLVLGLIIWRFMPWSESSLMAEAEKLMKSDLTMDHTRAKTDFLEPLVKRFPNGKYAEQATQMIIDVEKEETTKGMLRRAEKHQDPANEAERKYMMAESIRKDGNRTLALRQFRSIAQLFADQPEFRIYVLLAKDQIDKLSKEGSDEDYVQFLNEKLKKADADFKSGRDAKAEETWNSIINLYNGIDEVALQVKYARDRLKDKTPTPPWQDSNGNEESGK